MPTEAKTISQPDDQGVGDEPLVHTPGPWAWFGGKHGVYLATTHSGRRYVMDFVRKGMNGAQPRFQPTTGMVKSDELLMFEVGDRSVRGIKEAESDGSVYRYDVRGIDCADARLIAAAPELLDVVKRLQVAIGEFCCMNCITEEDLETEGADLLAASKAADRVLSKVV